MVLAAARARLRPRRRLVQLSERIDDRYGRVAAPRDPGSRQRVEVLGIYRSADTIVRAVAELRDSSHDVRFRLGAMADADPRLSAETARTHLQRGKFQNLNDLLDADHAAADWLLLIDDDVVLPRRFLDRFLATCRVLDFALAQPAQTRYSNANWHVAKRKLLSVARETHFVEIGPVTALRADAATKLCPFPADLVYGWGLDFHWAQVMLDAGLRLGVVDATAVQHVERKMASTYSWDAAQAEGRQFLAGVPHVPESAGLTTVRTRRRPLTRRRVS